MGARLYPMPVRAASTGTPALGSWPPGKYLDNRGDGRTCNIQIWLNERGSMMTLAEDAGRLHHLTKERLRRHQFHD